MKIVRRYNGLKEQGFLSRLPNIRTVAKRLRSRYFPERQLYFRANGVVRFISLSPRVQVATCVAALVFTGWVGVTSLNFLTRDEVLAAKEQEIRDMARAYEDLDAQMQRLQMDVKATAEQLRARQQFLQQIVGDDVAEPAPEEQEQENSPNPDSPSPGSNAATNSGSPVAFLLKAFGRDSSGSGSALEEIARMEQDLAQLSERQKDIAQRMLALTEQDMALAEKILKDTGLSKEQVLAIAEKNNEGLGQGGPFISSENELLAGTGADDAATDDPVLALYQSRMELTQLSSVFSNMPVMKPVEKYYISSGYGGRLDPMRKRRAIHYGVDMAGWWETPILASADGVVTYAGRNGAYGNFIEVSHENGFRTRFGHLKRIKVKSGQRVERGSVIGLMGSTGRSTGPHLHYEIWFEDKPLNPLKFFKAADDVLKIQEQYPNGSAT